MNGYEFVAGYARASSLTFDDMMKLDGWRLETCDCDWFCRGWAINWGTPHDYEQMRRARFDR